MIAERAAAQLAAHARRGAGARAIGEGGIRDAARQIDHEADRELGHRIHESGARARHQHAARGGGADVDIADVDRAADEGDELGQLLEHRRRPLGDAIGDDDLAAPGQLDQLRRRQRPASLVEAYLAELAQPGQRLVAVVQRAGVVGVGKQYGRHAFLWPARRRHKPRPILRARLPAQPSPAGSQERATPQRTVGRSADRETLWLELPGFGADPGNQSPERPNK